jgi:hypothetical protein
MNIEQMIREGAQALSPDLTPVFTARCKAHFALRPPRSQGDVSYVLTLVMLALGKRTQS